MPGREEALQDMVNAVTTRPVDREAIAKARAVLQSQHGQGTLVEAAVCVAFFEGMTKITDATGKQPVSGLLWSFMRCVFAMLRYLFELWVCIFGSSR